MRAATGEAIADRPAPSVLTRDDRIAAARGAILACLFHDERLAAEHLQPFDDPAVVVFHLLVADKDHAADICADLTDDLHRRFPGATASAEEQKDGWLCSIRVPVGSP